VTPANRLSLIIPVGPRERERPEILEGIARLPANWEIIVSLCPNAALSLPDRCRSVEGSPGRGAQLNRGIRAARGHWVWLLHADSRPDDQAIAGIDQAAGENEPMIGYCALRFERDGPRLTALNAIGANWRSRWLGLPYGDQGCFLRRCDFERLGGFREDLTRGEDLDLLVRARRLGIELHRLPGTITTSARRYRARGWLRTTVAHQFAAIRLIRDASRNSP
jgi:GT2 family glycosyltransferase